ncbi:DUF1464 family protein [Candidatus Micrarchaeota archaeon]|nr:DUF1464 family protein [Candidatus Micrarchaeota archaeon]
MRVKACGIDPGTKTWAIATTTDGKLDGYAEIDTKEAVESPRKIIDAVNSFGEFDAIAAPSGYGLPLKKTSELNEQDFELLLLKKNERKAIVGLERVLREMKASGMNAFVLPGVKHLQTVPDYRKINKIDLGTPDKVCACAAAIEDYCVKEKREYAEASFLFAEIGSAFNAFLAVDCGKIVDGIGGSCASMGKKARGRVDAELAYLMQEKANVFSGGLEDAEKKCEGAREAFLEGISKDLNALRVSLDCRRVVLSGRNAGELKKELELRGSEFEFEELKLEKKNVKAAAVGAALVADGLAGGRMQALVGNMKLKESRGSVLEFIC